MFGYFQICSSQIHLNEIKGEGALHERSLVSQSHGHGVGVVNIATSAKLSPIMQTKRDERQHFGTLEHPGNGDRNHL